jgi:hypothetical protein
MFLKNFADIGSALRLYLRAVQAKSCQATIAGE